MGKKVKKKGRSSPKEKRAASISPIAVLQEDTNSAETSLDGVVAVVKDRGVCSHVDKGIDLEKLSARLKSSESTKCEDCRGNVADRRAKKGQSKHGKKGGKNAKSESKAIWICLECGHYSCGGVGLPTTPQSHAVRHSKQNHHPLVVHYENHQLVWCFPCSKLVKGENSEDHKHKEVLNEVVKMLKAQPGEGSTEDVEDLWFGSGSVTSAIKSDYSISTDADGQAAYMIRGLCNLGNTCFFNSAVQNLLALSSLRSYFLHLDESIGPLTAAMRKLFIETGNEVGQKSVINPRSLFGSLCTKAPQFRGYQQHDSHELLRCLLDGMSTEELSIRKHNKSSEVSVKDPTFVDVIFGGQLSSTISCLECGHSSTIYEPFLDLSLPVPTKKPPPKRNQPPIGGKKQKLPPKRNGRNLSKVNRETNCIPRKSAFDQSSGSNSSGEVHSIAQTAGALVLNLGDSGSYDSTCPNDVALDMGLSAEDLSSFQNPENQPAVQPSAEQPASSDVFTWLDYLDPNESHEIYAASEFDDVLVMHDSANEDIPQLDVSLSVASHSKINSDFENEVREIPLDKAKSFDASEHGAIMQDPYTSLLIDENQNVKPQCDKGILLGGSLTEGGVGYDAGKDHSSPSCSQIWAEDSNTSGRDNDTEDSKVLGPKVMPLPNQEVGASSSVEAAKADASIEVSSSIVGNEEETSDFGGFGDLFNEPDDFLGDNPSSSVASDIVKSGVNGNTTESDPDEVDNADAPVTVEKCLAFFTKPELLSKDEHAWQCDNCSKILREQRIKSRQVQMRLSDTVPNGCGNGHLNGALDDEKTGDTAKGMTNNPDVDPPNGEVLQNGNHKLGDIPETEINGLQLENVELQTTNACPDSSECSDASNQNLSVSQGECDSNRVSSPDSDLLSGDQKDVNSESLKVKRDATKSILISKAPSVLTIHLKRFTQDARGRFSKLNGHVSFGERIQLKPYMDQRCTEINVSQYRLVGVVEHLGTMRGGHYVAYVRGGSKDNGECVWYHASDAHVRQASLEEVMRSEAYILFYERS